MKCSSIVLLLIASALAGCVSARRVMDFTLHEPSTCQVHGVSMTVKLVGTTFGMKRDRWSLALWDARSKSFPHADEVYDTGACLPSYEKYARIYVCPSCGEARTRWMESHPHNRE